MPLNSVTPKPQPSEASPSVDSVSRFVFVACQHGTEPSIKSRLMNPERPYRLAFSRPGLLTFKISETPSQPSAEGQNTAKVAERELLPQDLLIRQSGFALGQLRGDTAEKLASEVIEMAGTDWNTVHVFARDYNLPGMRGFEPGQSELVTEVREILMGKMPLADLSGNPPAPDEKILDVILIEPNHWLVGYHYASKIHHGWPGGVFPIMSPEEVVSRAYYKMAEACAWSRLPLMADDRIVEIGSSPGGACQRLLDLGLKVTGVDPAEMDPLILEHPRFEHWRSKTAGLRRKMFRKFQWLAVDANVAPNYTLDMLEDIVVYPGNRIKGLLITLKLSNYDLVDSLDEYLARIRKWGYERVEARQLASNRRECCIVAELKSR